MPGFMSKKCPFIFHIVVQYTKVYCGSNGSDPKGTKSDRDMAELGFR